MEKNKWGNIIIKNRRTINALKWNKKNELINAPNQNTINERMLARRTCAQRAAHLHLASREPSIRLRQARAITSSRIGILRCQSKTHASEITATHSMTGNYCAIKVSQRSCDFVCEMRSQDTGLHHDRQGFRDWRLEQWEQTCHTHESTWRERLAGLTCAFDGRDWSLASMFCGEPFKSDSSCGWPMACCWLSRE